MNGGGSRHQGRATRRGGGGGGGGGSVSAPRGGDGQPPPGEAAHVSRESCVRADGSSDGSVRAAVVAGMGPAIRVGDVRRAWREGNRGHRRVPINWSRWWTRRSRMCRDSCACARAARGVVILCMWRAAREAGADIDFRSQRSACADSSGYTSRSGQLSSVSAGSVQHETKASQTTHRSTEGDQSGGRIGLVSLGVHGAVAPPIA